MFFMTNLLLIGQITDVYLPFWQVDVIKYRWINNLLIDYDVFQELAVKNESGLSGNPLKISWLEGQPEVVATASQSGQFMSSQVLK